MNQISAYIFPGVHRIFFILLWSLTLNGYSQVLTPGHASSVLHSDGGAKLASPRSVYVSGNYAYIASVESNALEIIDITDPNAPIHKGSITHGDGGALLDGAYSVFVSGNLAYVASSGSKALEIVDVTDPAYPFHVGCISHGYKGALLDGAMSIFVVGNYAYVASSNSKALEIIDISNPSRPEHKGSLVHGTGGASLDGPTSVFVSGNLAYITSTTSDALEIVDVTIPELPKHKGQLSNGVGGATLSWPMAIYVSGNYAYVGNYKDPSLEIIDVTNAAEPVHKGKISVGKGGAPLNGINSVFVSGNNAYVGSSVGSTLEIIDISNPTLPVNKGSLAMYDASVYVIGNYAYAISTCAMHITCGSFNIIDVSNPANPIEKSSISDAEGGAILTSATSVYASGNYAYVTSNNRAALEILDISNPAYPVHKGSFEGIGGPASVSVKGNYAYVVGSNTLNILDVSNPTKPLYVGVIKDGFDGAFLGGAMTVFVSGDFAYVACRGQLDGLDNGVKGSLVIIDISTPSSPVYKGKITNGEGGARLISANSVYVSGNFAYVTSYDYPGGILEIIDVSNPSAPVHKASLGTGRAPVSIFVSGNYAYIALVQSFEVIDVSNPTAPFQVAELLEGAGGALLTGTRSIFVSGDYAFVVSTHSEALEIINIKDPTKPVHAFSVLHDESGSGAILRNINSVFVKDNYAYVAGFYGLEVVYLYKPPQPAVRLASSVEQSQFQANWAGTGATQYYVDVSTDNFASFVSGYNHKPASGSSLMVTGISTGVYQYRVKAENLNGVSEDSKTMSVLAFTPEGIPSVTVEVNDPVENNPTISLFPNPAEDNIQVQLQHPQSGQPISIELFDVLGRRIKNSTQFGETIQVDTSDLLRGFYLIRVNQSGVMYQSRFMKR